MFRFSIRSKTISQPNVQMSVKKQTEGVTTRQQSRSATRKKKKNSSRRKKIKSPAESGPEKPKNKQKPHLFSQLPRVRPSGRSQEPSRPRLWPGPGLPVFEMAAKVASASKAPEAKNTARICSYIDLRSKRMMVILFIIFSVPKYFYQKNICPNFLQFYSPSSSSSLE